MTTKLRTYRLYKSSVETETYVKQRIPRFVRRIVAQFCSGCLLLAIETERYARPQTPLNETLCYFCDERVVEDEKHFLINFALDNDIRYYLNLKARNCIQNFDTQDLNTQFIRI